MIKKVASVLFLCALIAGTWIALSRSAYREAEGQIFGTTYHIKYHATKDLSAVIEAELHAVDSALSMFIPTSTLSKFNAAEKYAEKDALFTSVVRLALQVSEATDGDFDPTVAPLVDLWGFGLKHRDDVTPDQVDKVMPHVGYHHLSYDARRQCIVKDDAQTRIDCGAIAKGYAVDRVAHALQKCGATDYMVEIGGEMIVRGHNKAGEKWRVGINKPVEDSTGSGELQTVIAITNRAMATSGNYRNYYYRGGRRYAHTINPHDGNPISHSLLSATVIAPTCAEADAYATAFMVMGLDKAKLLLAKDNRLEAYFIFTDGKDKLQTWSTPNFGSK